jgi:hypothetical protein
VINKVKWGPVIDKIVLVDADGKYHYTIIAGNASSCLPTICCKNGKFDHKLPCFAVAMGYQADAIIYEYLKTYTLRLPIYNLWPKIATNSSVQDEAKTKARLLTNKIIFYSIIIAFEEAENGGLVYDKGLFRRRHAQHKTANTSSK